jgi:hypothetical protein
MRGQKPFNWSIENNWSGGRLATKTSLPDPEYKAMCSGIAIKGSRLLIENSGTSKVFGSLLRVYLEPHSWISWGRYGR